MQGIVADLADPEQFCSFFAIYNVLGSGSDGKVFGYQHLSSGRVIAVKVPHPGRFWTSHSIEKEVAALMNISRCGEHENIARMLAYGPEFGDDFGPAIFFECAEFGSLLDYRWAWRKQECDASILEPMVWKLFKDLVLALDFLHNKCGMIHRDVKTDNVLVSRPSDYTNDLIPAIPVFKLCDFSRVVAYSCTDCEIHPWYGTVDFAPPFTEREKARPAGDMWSLGATIQEFALGVCPVQSRKALLAQMDKLQEPHPKLDGDEELWAHEEWGRKFSAAYRPLNAYKKTLMEQWDVPQMPPCHKPFSGELNEWYAKLWETDWELRATSASLVEDLIPSIDGYIGVDEEREKHRTDSVLVTRTAMLPHGAPACDKDGYRPQ